MQGLPAKCGPHPTPPRISCLVCVTDVNLHPLGSCAAAARHRVCTYLSLLFNSWTVAIHLPLKAEFPCVYVAKGSLPSCSSEAAAQAVCFALGRPMSALLSRGGLAAASTGKATGMQCGSCLIIHRERCSPVGNAVFSGFIFSHC